MDPRRRLAVGSVDETEDLAGFLVDPVVLVVHAVLALHADIRFVGPRDCLGRDAGDVMDVQIRRHRDLLALVGFIRRRDVTPHHPYGPRVSSGLHKTGGRTRRNGRGSARPLAQPFGWTTPSTLRLGSRNQAAQE